MNSIVAEEIDSEYRQHIADSLRNNSQNIADDWLNQLDEIIDEHLRDIFPTELLLDHIPSLIEEIAKVVAVPEDELAVTSSLIARKAKELGSLRHKQNATVHQLIREYDMLANVLEKFVIAESDKFGGKIAYKDCIHMMAGMAHIVRMILQSTVDTFVEIYMKTINTQTDRLIAFNNFVSHELKTPLQAAMLNAELLLENKTIEQDETQELLAIKSSVQQATGLLKDIDRLTSTSTDQNDSPVTAEVDVATLINDISIQLEEMLDDRDVEINADKDLGSITANTANLELILTNILTNAIKYSDPSKNKRYLNIRYNKDSTDKYILEISDNGLGIAENMQEEVFKLRIRAHNNSETTKHIQGHGLGLYLVREAVEKMNGTIEMTSEETKGTCFTLSLPKNGN